MKLTKVNILGRIYKIEYKDSPCEVDSKGRESLWGQIDPWDRVIRIYDKNKSDEEIFEILLHEIMHGLFIDLNLENMEEEDHNLLCLALADVLIRNNIVNLNLNPTALTFVGLETTVKKYKENQ